MKKLDEYISPKKNIDYEIFQFRQAKQNIDETTDQFATRLRRLAAHCEFHNANNEVKSAILSHDWEAWRSHEIAQRMRQSLHMWSSIEEEVLFIKNFWLLI